MKQLSLSILLIICYQITIGQDIHFSQFNNSPLNLSPSLIGNFTGDFRLVANQRTQWNAVTTPYSTSSFSAEAKNISKTPMSGGLSVYNDKAGDSRFSTLQITIGGSYSVYSKDSSQSINFSIQPAFTQRSINYDPLKFDNQYNGAFYDANLDNGESFVNSGRNYFNLRKSVV